ncbi:hypothetical protein [Moorena sp. SIOASIH]|uniref:hypothetical protein n=1 Tax=Moorena sp. SIOASIH TaxID=2607817 RepID=UPI0025D1EC1B|nr:hypothetical protein [Moorena sp. SIOASIH]
MSILLSNKHLTVERASCCLTSILLWNGHLAVERASCCGTGILPVTIPGQAGCPPHSYSFEDSAMPALLAQFAT